MALAKRIIQYLWVPVSMGSEFSFSQVSASANEHMHPLHALPPAHAPSDSLPNPIIP